MLKGETGSRKLKNRGKKVMVRKRLEMKVRSLRQLWAKRMMNFSIDEDVWAAEKEKSSMRERERERERKRREREREGERKATLTSLPIHLPLASQNPNVVTLN